MSRIRSHKPSPPGRTGLLDGIEAFANEHFGGIVTRPLVVTLTTAKLA